jgi:hypothetical protein
LPKHTQQVTFSKKEKDAELPYHLLPEHTQQAMIINAFTFDDKSSATLKLVVASVTNEDLKRSTKGSLAHFDQLPVGVSAAPIFFNGKISSIFWFVIAFLANKYNHYGISRHPPPENGPFLFNKKDIRFIVNSEGAQFAPATLQVQARNHQTDFQQVASHFINIVGFQRVVELIPILNSEGERNVSKTTSRLIVDLISVKHLSKLIVPSFVWLPNATSAHAKHFSSSKSSFTSGFNSQFIVKYIYLADSVGAHTAISCNKTTFEHLS